MWCLKARTASRLPVFPPHPPHPSRSLATVYASMAVFIFIAPAIIERLTAKVAIVVGASCYWCVCRAALQWMAVVPAARLFGGWPRCGRGWPCVRLHACVKCVLCVHHANTHLVRALTSDRQRVCVCVASAVRALPLASVFIGSFIHVVLGFYFFASALNGFGASLLWTSQGILLTRYARGGGVCSPSGALLCLLIVCLSVPSPPPPPSLHPHPPTPHPAPSPPYCAPVTVCTVCGI
jgi:hypothetical protein